MRVCFLPGAVCGDDLLVLLEIPVFFLLENISEVIRMMVDNWHCRIARTRDIVFFQKAEGISLENVLNEGFTSNKLFATFWNFQVALFPNSFDSHYLRRQTQKSIVDLIYLQVKMLKHFETIVKTTFRETYQIIDICFLQNS